MFWLKKKKKVLSLEEEKVTPGYPLISCRGFYKYVVANLDLSNAELLDKITAEPTYTAKNSYDVFDLITVTRNAIATA